MSLAEAPLANKCDQRISGGMNTNCTQRFVRKCSSQARQIVLPGDVRAANPHCRQLLELHGVDVTDAVKDMRTQRNKKLPPKCVNRDSTHRMTTPSYPQFKF
eukprot:1467786-Amphidinium_carterae.1